MYKSKKKSIAIITFLCPYPVSDGGRFGVHSFVNDIRRLFDVTLVFKVPLNEKRNVETLNLLWPEVDIRPFYSDNSIKSNVINERQSLYKKLVTPFRKLKYRKRIKRGTYSQNPHIIHGLYPFVPVENEFLFFLEQLFASKQFDVVQIEYSDLLNLVHIIPEGAKKVFFQHENRYSILEDYFNISNNKSLYASYIVNTAKFTEINLMSLYDRILVLNHNDQARLSKHITLSKLCVMPTSVPQSLIPRCIPSSKAERLVFMGSQEHPPNADAVKWYVQEMHNKILSKTGLELYVTGAWKDAFKFQNPQVKFTGFVDNLADVLQGSILVAPIRLGGGGIRIKILQAMACGVPVIATSLITDGMEGIEDGNNIIIANTAADFIAAIQTLTTESTMYSRISKNGIKLINEYYEEKAAIRIKKKIFEELLNEE